MYNDAVQTTDKMAIQQLLLHNLKSLFGEKKKKIQEAQK